MLVSSRKAPEGFETPEDINLFHHTLTAVAEYQKQAAEARDEAEEKALEAEAWAHGREDHPEQKEDNAKYYAGEAQKAAASIPGRVEEGKKALDEHVRQKEKELRGDTGNVYFPSFRVVAGRLMMYSDPKVDRIRFYRKGSRLMYQLKN